MVVPKYKCYNSKDEIINEVMGNLEYDIDQAKCDSQRRFRNGPRETKKF